MARSIRRQRLASSALLAAVVACGAASALWALAGIAWVATPLVRLRDRPLQRSLMRRATDVDTEVYISDSSPRGTEVLKAYKELISLKSSDEKAVGEIMGRLDAEQKAMLKSIINAKGGKDVEITTTDPEIGDTVERLFKKYMMLEGDDDAALAWRDKVDMMMMKNVQVLIEQHQMKLADAEASAQHEDDESAQKAWDLFVKQFPGAAERGDFMGTPTRPADVKYRFRRLKEAMQIDSDVALEILAKDSTPMFVDPDFIRRTWKAMVDAAGYEEALEEIVKKHPGALVTQAKNVKEKIKELKVGAAVIGAFSGIKSMFGR